MDVSPVNVILTRREHPMMPIPQCFDDLRSHLLNAVVV